jgi:site-specific DNA-methyltransferase (adenine-specific)
MKPYFDDGQVTLYLGDCREVVPALGLTADLLVCDCPYGETSLAWDRWVDGWPALAATCSRSMWAFGSMRMYLKHGAEFTAAGWRMSQDIIWEKNDGTGFHTDRFRRVHENAVHWYQGNRWTEIYHEGQRRTAPPASPSGVPPTPGRVVRQTARGARGPHLGTTSPKQPWIDDGLRMMRSVIYAANRRGKAIAPTEKPVALLDPLIRYGCPPGGLVLDLFAGSASTLEAARQSGRRAIGIEADEAQIELAATRLSQGILAVEQERNLT